MRLPRCSRSACRLLLSLAAAARTIRAQAAAAAAIPIVALCGYLTFSRGGLLAFAVALIVFLALAPDRIPKLVTVAVAGAPSAALIAGARPPQRARARPRQRGRAAPGQRADPADHPRLRRGRAGAGRRSAWPPATARRPRVLTVSVRQARWGLAVAVVVAGCGGAGRRAPPAGSRTPGRTSRTRRSPALRQESIQRFGTVSGNGRYDYWKAAVDSTSGGHLLQGNGPGTFQLLWLPRAPYHSYVENAHSLYFETLAEVGTGGPGAAGRLPGAGDRAWGSLVVVRTRDEARAMAAGVTAATVAFAVSAGSDWIWQVPALPAAFLLLAAARAGPLGSSPRSRLRARRGPRPVRRACRRSPSGRA